LLILRPAAAKDSESLDASPMCTQPKEIKLHRVPDVEPHRTIAVDENNASWIKGGNA
jgi:hypothetical protein